MGEKADKRKRKDEGSRIREPFELHFGKGRGKKIKNVKRPKIFLRAQKATKKKRGVFRVFFNNLFLYRIGL